MANYTMVEKIITKHLIKGDLKRESQIVVKVNQTLTQDSTGTMVYLQLAAMHIDKVKTDLSVAYIDHNTLQTGFENADDHEFIRTSAKKYGIVYSKPGNGICHQLHLERFAKPGTVLIGSDSHTPTCGGIGALAVGAGGLDVALGMATGNFRMMMPKIMNIILTGTLKKGASPKDIILSILKKLTVIGGVGYILEYTGSGLMNLSVTDRATIANMGAELGATTSIFPSDDITEDFLARQNRASDFTELGPDIGAIYDNVIQINLSEIVPMVAMPHSPDNVSTVSEIQGLKVNQVAIGSCTNSSYTDMMKVARILEGKSVHPEVSLVISPGSSNVLNMLIENGALKTMIESGARILESACGPCIGMGQAPATGAVSLRTFNRNFKGRSGTKDAQVYIVSPETAALSAIEGFLCDPSDLTVDLNIEIPKVYSTKSNYWIFSESVDSHNEETMNVYMGPNIKPFPMSKAITNHLSLNVFLKTGDNITTDDIVPSSANLLPLRSNVPELSKYAFKTISDDFYETAQSHDDGIIVGGENYGQGSSREHAALVPVHLGVRVVLAKSFARIHRSNLINSGILPLVFIDESDYEKVNTNDELHIDDLLNSLDSRLIRVVNDTTKSTFKVSFKGSDEEIEILKCGGALNWEVQNG